VTVFAKTLFEAITFINAVNVSLTFPLGSFVAKAPFVAKVGLVLQKCKG
jgi:hypothetical protein